MNDTATLHNTASDSTQSNQFKPFALIKDSCRQTNVCCNARLLLVFLRVCAGIRGEISYSIGRLSNELGKSETQVRSYIHELINAGLLERIEVPGRSNSWRLPDVYYSQFQATPTENRTHKRTKKEENNVKNCDAIFSYPSEELKPTNSNIIPFQEHPVVTEIIQVTEDTKPISKRRWRKIARLVPLPIIYAAISSLKVVKSEGTLINGGAYFNSIISKQYPEINCPCERPNIKSSVSLHGKRPENGTERTDMHTPIDETPTLSHEENLEFIRSIKEILNQKGALESDTSARTEKPSSCNPMAIPKPTNQFS